MSNTKVNEPRIKMEIPISFHEKVKKAAAESGQSMTVFLETANIEKVKK